MRVGGIVFGAGSAFRVPFLLADRPVLGCVGRRARALRRDTIAKPEGDGPELLSCEGGV